MHRRGQAEVANADLSRVRVDKDVVTLEVAMDDGMRLLLMQVDQTLKNLLAPAFDDLQSRAHDALDVLLERATGDHLSDEDDLLLFVVVPCRDEVNDVRVVKLLDKVYLRLDTQSVLLRQAIEVDHVPSDLMTCVVVNTAIDYLVGATTKLLAEPLEPTLGRSFHDDV